MYQEGMLKEGALKGQTIIVTGGGTGLGRAMGTYFLELGANLVITSRKLEVLETTANEMAGLTGGRVLPVACDVRNYEEAFNTIIDIVLRGTSNFTLATGKHWIKKKQPGTFLNIVTTYAYTGSGYVVPSAAAKAGVLAMTRSLAVEWAKYKIRCNAIAPGPFPTKGAWSRLLPGKLAKKLDPVQRIPVGRVGEHQELANLAAYLMSDYSAYVNGEVITIDGGEWLKGAGEFNSMEAVSSLQWDMFEMMRKKK